MSTSDYGKDSNLTLTVMDDHDAIAREAAHQIADALRKKPDLVLGLATGATMEPVYAELVRMHKDEGLDFSQARFFNLDAYEGVPSSDRNSYDNQLRKLLINNVNATAENVNFVQGIGFDPDAYEDKIKQAGGIDIQLLGLGGEGHIGFNEVGSTIDSRTRRVPLDERTKEDNAMYFNKPGEKVPDAAFTMGVGTILEAKKIIMLANNPNKAWAVRNMMDHTGTQNPNLTSLELHHMHKIAGEDGIGDAGIDQFFEAQQQGTRNSEDPVADLPVRALHAHKDATILIDKEAASMTRPTDLLQRSNLEPHQVQDLLDEFSPHEITVSIQGESKTLLLPPGFDFYDPETMDLNEKFDYTKAEHITALGKALERTTDVGVGAHQDDIEIMAGPQLLEASDAKDKHWMSIIVTDGAASKSVLTGTSTNKTPKELTAQRQLEQREAAQEIGTPVIQLKYPSAAINAHMGAGKLQEASYALGSLMAAMPEMKTAYGHNPIDKHHSHLGVLAVQTAALRAANPPKLENVYGMEVWGGLTGTPESMLEMGVVKNNTDLARITSLVGKYVSQIDGQGRDYAEGTTARIQGHGNYVSNPHLANPPVGMVIGINVTDFVKGNSQDMAALAGDILDRTKAIKMKMAERHDVPETPNLTDGYRNMVLQGAQQPSKPHRG